MLNDAQKEAVDTIDGPLLVIAGPGTGKTELLSMRVANILIQTDVLPENILCLTFTDSAASSMRKRLADIIGTSAYKVAIHTFHSFGTETINQNSEFFYSGASFRPVDDLTTREILINIFDELEYDNSLASKMNNEYTYLSDVVKVISELKKSGLTDEELRQILEKNDSFIEHIEPKLANLFEQRVSKQTLEGINVLLPEILSLMEPTNIVGITPLSRVMYDSLEQTLQLASEDPKTTPPITIWKNTWFKKDHTGKKLILKSSENQKKLHALSYIYFKYLSTMRERGLFDYDDMILDVVHCIETNPELKATLQEKYQYILVDEFQDTNLAQMRIIYNLADNPVNEGRPNVMAVGDDDQAIFSFHGADIGNILHFKENYKDVKIVTLKENYRSTQPILSVAREIIIQGNDRLETRTGINKTLNSNSQAKETTVEIIEVESASDERGVLIDNIVRNIKSGEAPESIAVIARRHSELVALLPYFSRARIAVNYERRDNILENELIILVEKLSRLLTLLSHSQHKQVDNAIAEIVSHPALGFDPVEIWRLSLDAYESRAGWLKLMLQSDKFSSFAQWIIDLSAKSSSYPLERILDEIVGNVKSEDGGYKSTIFNYYFSPEKLEKSPNEYVFYLEALRTLRTKIKEYDPLSTPTIEVLVRFIELNRRLGNEIKSQREEIRDNSKSVNLMTAHKSKGLEFDRVYILNAVDSAWGERVRGNNRKINYPENLPIAFAGNSPDERLRLFFVATTRAKKHLTISYSVSDKSSKDTIIASFLSGSSVESARKTTSLSIQDVAENEWYSNILNIPADSIENLLRPILQDFKLSATNLNNFIDLEKGGPSNFLLNNLLQFPQAMSESASYGTAIHQTLQKAHNHFVSTGKKRPIEDILNDFEKLLSDQRLPEVEFSRSLARGFRALQSYLQVQYDSLKSTQKTELSFRSQGVQYEGAELTGQLDLVDIDERSKTITVTDYKTGKPSNNWSGKNKYEKVKLHKYKQQLMFYRLLIENSRDYSKYAIANSCLQFVEPDKSGKIINLGADFSEQDYEEFKRLVVSVWNKIIALQLPDVSVYGTSYKGILDFEQDLIDGKI